MPKREPKLIDVLGPVEVWQVGWRPRYFDYVCTAHCTDPMGRVKPSGDLGIILAWAAMHAQVAHDWREVADHVPAAIMEAERIVAEHRPRSGDLPQWVAEAPEPVFRAWLEGNL